MLVVAFFVGGVRLAAAVGEGGQSGGFQQLHHQGGAGTRQAGDEGDEVCRGHAGEGFRAGLEGGHGAGLRIVPAVQGAGGELLEFGEFGIPQGGEPLARVFQEQRVLVLAVGIEFPAGDLAQHAEAGGKQGGLGDGGEERVLGRRQLAQPVVGEAEEVVALWLEVE